MDIYLLYHEIEAIDMFSLEDVVRCDEDGLSLEKEFELLVEQVCI
ncbi:hypothetical protein ISN45_Aa05g005560, partial [Arabidopsis thaliana x Arabidopsis arenosa]